MKDKMRKDRKDNKTHILKPVEEHIVELMLKKNKWDYYCSTCNEWITPAHGGIRCRKCEHLYCVDKLCIDPSYCADPLFMIPQSIRVCHKCEGIPFPDNESTIIELYPVHEANYLLSKISGKKLITSPPPRHGMESKETKELWEIKEEQEKREKPDPKKVEYYDL